MDGASDSRNLASQEFIINVENVADSPPIFLSAPPVTRVPENSKIGIITMIIITIIIINIKGTLWLQLWRWMGTRDSADPSDTSWTRSELR